VEEIAQFYYLKGAREKRNDESKLGGFSSQRRRGRMPGTKCVNGHFSAQERKGQLRGSFCPQKTPWQRRVGTATLENPESKFGLPPTFFRGRNGRTSPFNLTMGVINRNPKGGTLLGKRKERKEQHPPKALQKRGPIVLDREQIPPIGTGKDMEDETGPKANAQNPSFLGKGG